MPDFSTTARRPRVRAVDGVLLAAGLVALVTATYAASAALAELRAARMGVDAARQEAEGLRARTQALESSGEARDEGVAAQVLLSAESPPPRVVADLAALMPGDVRLEGVSLAYTRRVDVEARVVARGASAYDLFLRRLGESRRFSDVVPGGENREGEVKASVQMVYRAGVGR